MKKTLAITVLSASILTLSAGAIAASNGFFDSTDTSIVTETTIAGTTTTTNANVAAINEAVTQGIEAIESAVNEGISQVQAVATTQEVTTVTETTATTKTGSETFNVTESSEFQYGAMNFTSVKINYDTNKVVFYYKASINSSTSAMPKASLTTCTDNNANIISCSAFVLNLAGESDESSSDTINYEGSIGFSNFTDASALSTITITYAFEGIDPVTVTIDIPCL